MPVIPLVVSPSAAVRYALDPNPVITADRPVVFSLPAPNTGTLEVVSASSAILHPANRSQDLIVHAVSTAVPANTGDALIRAWGSVPHQPNWGNEINLDNRTIVSLAEDDSEVLSVKRGPLQTWQWVFDDNTFLEKEALKQFWLFHQKHHYWYYPDLSEGDDPSYTPLTYFVRFDSGLKIIPQHPDSFQITCVVTERPFTQVVG